jgi:hypothetical protein
MAEIIAMAALDRMMETGREADAAALRNAVSEMNDWPERDDAWVERFLDAVAPARMRP